MDVREQEKPHTALSSDIASEIVGRGRCKWHSRRCGFVTGEFSFNRDGFNVLVTYGSVRQCLQTDEDPNIEKRDSLVESSTKLA